MGDVHGPHKGVVRVGHLRYLHVRTRLLLYVPNLHPTLPDDQADVRVRDLYGDVRLTFRQCLLELRHLRRGVVPRAGARPTSPHHAAAPPAAEPESRPTRGHPPTPPTAAAADVRHHPLPDHPLDDRPAVRYRSGIVRREGDDPHARPRGHLVLLLYLHPASGPTLHRGYGFAPPSDDESHDAVRDADLLLQRRRGAAAEVGGSGGTVGGEGRRAGVGLAEDLCHGLGGVPPRGQDPVDRRRPPPNRGLVGVHRSELPGLLPVGGLAVLEELPDELLSPVDAVLPPLQQYVQRLLGHARHGFLPALGIAPLPPYRYAHATPRACDELALLGPTRADEQPHVIVAWIAIGGDPYLLHGLVIVAPPPVAGAPWSLRRRVRIRGAEAGDERRQSRLDPALAGQVRMLLIDPFSSPPSSTAAATEGRVEHGAHVGGVGGTARRRRRRRRRCGRGMGVMPAPGHGGGGDGRQPREPGGYGLGAGHGVGVGVHFIL